MTAYQRDDLSSRIQDAGIQASLLEVSGPLQAMPLRHAESGELKPAFLEF